MIVAAEIMLMKIAAGEAAIVIVATCGVLICKSRRRITRSHSGEAVIVKIVIIIVFIVVISSIMTNILVIVVVVVVAVTVVLIVVLLIVVIIVIILSILMAQAWLTTCSSRENFQQHSFNARS